MSNCAGAPGEDEWAEFAVPSSLHETEANLLNFITKQRSNNRKIVVITSGGTTVPLENNTVRFIDNFSTGTRGSAAAEYFLEAGYGVIFIYRLKTLMPFLRHLDRNKGLKLLDIFQFHRSVDNSKNIIVDQSQIPDFARILENYQSVQKNGMLLCIGFLTLCDYFHYLKAAAEAIQPFGREAIIFLAAAVSDFYVPGYALPEHKIQSSTGPPVIHLRQVPKMLGVLTQQWANSAFVVSFKLETDQLLVVQKARGALEKYKHQVVIANLLHSRRRKLEIITAADDSVLTLNDDELSRDIELEGKLVADLVRRHVLFYSRTITK